MTHSHGSIRPTSGAQAARIPAHFGDWRLHLIF
jgi:hypothetical protein